MISRTEVSRTIIPIRNDCLQYKTGSSFKIPFSDSSDVKFHRLSREYRVWKGCRVIRELTVKGTVSRFLQKTMNCHIDSTKIIL